MDWKPVQIEGKWFAQNAETGEVAPKDGLDSRSKILEFIKKKFTVADIAQKAKTMAPKPPAGPEMGAMGGGMPPSGNPMDALASMMGMGGAAGGPGMPMMPKKRGM